VNVRVSWTIVLWPLFFTWTFAKFLPPAEAFGWGAALTVGLFATTWVHEMGHIAMGRRCGIDTELMTLRGLGGLAHLKAPAQTPADEIRISLAGPATHLLWLAVLFPATRLLEDRHTGELWFAMLDGFTSLQLWMLVFNLLPVHPLDGGSVLRGALALRMHATRASYYVANAGFVGNGAFVVLGLLAWMKVADPFGFGPYGFLLLWIGIEGIQACRQLRFEAQYGDVYGDHDPFQRTLLASQASLREADREEAKERETRRAARGAHRQLQETADRLLDRVNEVGGVENLSTRERRELERVSRALATDARGRTAGAPRTPPAE
jgi:Zn-dependent protease